MSAKHYAVPMCSANKKTSPLEILFTRVQFQDKNPLYHGAITHSFYQNENILIRPAPKIKNSISFRLIQP